MKCEFLSQIRFRKFSSSTFILSTSNSLRISFLKNSFINLFIRRDRRFDVSLLFDVSFLFDAIVHSTRSYTRRDCLFDAMNYSTWLLIRRDCLFDAIVYSTLIRRSHLFDISHDFVYIYILMSFWFTSIEMRILLRKKKETIFLIEF